MKFIAIRSSSLVYISLGVIGFLLSQHLLWKNGKNNIRTDLRKCFYYFKTHALLHYKYQSKAYLPTIISSLLTTVTATIILFDEQNSTHVVSLLVNNSTNAATSKPLSTTTTTTAISTTHLQTQMNMNVMSQLKNLFFLSGIYTTFYAMSIFLMNLNIISVVYSSNNNSNRHQAILPSANVIELFENSIENEMRGELIGNLSQQLFDIRSILHEYCLNVIQCDIGPQIREEIISYIGFPIFSNNKIQESIELFDYVHNSLKKQLMVDERYYAQNYAVFGHWSTKLFINAYAIAEIYRQFASSQHTTAMAN